MSDLDFYTNPMSRSRIVRWMLEEVGAPYEQHLLDYGTTMKAPDYLAINPMGKVPAIVHKGHVVTECAAICAYLADAFPEAGLAPAPTDRADYYRWLFFAAGPLEQAIINTRMGWAGNEEQRRMLGYGSFDDAIHALEGALAGRSFMCGDCFSAADVYVGSQVDWGLQFNWIPQSPILIAYAGALRERPAYKRAQEIDNALAAEIDATASS